MEEFLRLEKIHKSFVGVHALKGVDFTLRKGEIHCLVGENGCGKSTLIKIISGVLQPDSGRIVVEGQPVASLGSAATMARGIQVIYQDLSLFPNLTVAERITVFRDGGRVATRPPNELDDDRLVALMTGRTLARKVFAFADANARKVLGVRGLSKRNHFADVSLELRAGEIVGLTGLIGSGRTELALALFGISPAESGEIRVEGKPVQIRSVQDAVAAGIAYVPENRLVQGLVMKHSVEANVTATVLDRLLGRLGLVDPARKQALAREWIKALGIKVANPAVPVQTLSGGNQQKVVIAKWLAGSPRILKL